ncbi:UNVERIFIED_CONTAM: hypothetical protein PYX00_009505 [Menopon gallinae]|uniref:RWD domain-containing protein n=1 Tax=Menopon gallinae TaxID=328185 RepID=A0AAW2HBM9_9NEOP
MDYKEEQVNEVEALQSIYCDELEILGTEPHKFCIKIKSDCDRDKEDGLTCTMKFTYTEKYPDELPLLDIVDHQNFTAGDEEELMSYLVEQANENLGMVMVFTIVSAAQEWLSTRWDQIKKDRELEAERRLKESEEEERRKFEGTKVTVESFMNWKRAFEEELGLTKKELKDEREGRKLTGTVKVDESLFQDLDELDLDETELQDD